MRRGFLLLFCSYVFLRLCYIATNARPYALTLLCSICAIYQLILLHDSFHWRYAAGYVSAATLMVYMHHISAPFFLLFMTYSVIWIKHGYCANKPRVYLAHAMVIILLLPLTYLILNARYDSSVLSFANTPTFIQLLRAILTDITLLAIFIYTLSKLLLRENINALFPLYNSRVDAFIYTWLLLPIFAFYIASIITNYNVFTGRYIVFSYSALALLLAAMLQNINFRTIRYEALVLLCGFSMIYTGGSQLFPNIHHEDWRGALSLVRQIAEPYKGASYFSIPDTCRHKILDGTLNLQAVLNSARCLYIQSIPK